MKQVEIEAQVRTKSGKSVARKLRKQGMIPGVLYGPKTDPVPLSVNLYEFKKLLYAAKGERLVFSLNLRDNGSTGSRLALVKELQLHPVNDEIRHVDFYEVFLDEEVTVSVPIKPVGKAKGVEEGGLLEIIHRTVEVSCLPMAIPKEIKVDVTHLGIGDALHVEDVTPPEGVRLLDEPKLTLMTVVGAEVEEGTGEEEEEGEIPEESS